MKKYLNWHYEFRDYDIHGRKLKLEYSDLLLLHKSSHWVPYDYGMCKKCKEAIPEPILAWFKLKQAGFNDI